MGTKRTEEFRQEAVRIALTSGLTRKQIASDLDEAHEYADKSLETLLNQGRKYRAGIVIAHQYLDQLNNNAKQALLTNASIKIVGGLSHKDNQALSREMGTDTDFLSSLRKKSSSTEFGLWIKHVIPHALRLNVPFGLLESAVRLDERGVQLQLEFNRLQYCVPLNLAALTDETEIQAVEIKAVEVVAQEDVPATEGRGGSQHKELQKMIKGCGHDLGFGVATEAACQNSRGAIDVLLTGEKQIIAVEVSITTSPEHELENIQKCFAETVDQVLCVSPDNTHRVAIQNLCIEALNQTQLNKVTFLHPQDVTEYLTGFDERETALIRGYEVVTRLATSDPRDVEYRRNRIRQVLGKRLG